MFPNVKVVIILTFICFVNCEQSVKPNIVFILADDLGWNDVSHHGSDAIPTPNIDILGYDGVFLNRYYTYSTCTPTRSSLLTGQYAHKLGMQAHPLRYGENRAVPPSVKLLPEYLKDSGYSTHLIGKWHIGMSRKKELPTSRGFDSHFGIRGGHTDFYEYFNEQPVYFNESTFVGLDLFENLTPAWNTSGYLTRVLTDKAVKAIQDHNKSNPLFLYLAHPATHSQNVAARLQAPPETVRAHRHIRSLGRRIYAAMVSELDKSIGKVIKTLEKTKLLNNTIIIFASDNGAAPIEQYFNLGSNYPFRGMKFSSLEGGIRVPALIWSPHLKSDKSHTWQGHMHVSDWLPTLLNAVGVEIPEGLDGVSQWENINDNKEGRNDISLDVDDVQNLSAYIHGDYKLLIGDFDTISNKQYGEDFDNLMFPAPLYERVLEKSDTFKSLKKLGRQINFQEAIKVRKSITVDCGYADSKDACIPTKGKPCLFNIVKDPCELIDISADYPELVSLMRTRIENEWSKRIPRTKRGDVEPNADPTFFGHVWETWLRDDE